MKKNKIVNSAAAIHGGKNKRTTKLVSEAYILAIGLGFFGFHHFYLHRLGFGVIYLLTLGVFGIGYTVDLFRIPRLVRLANAIGENPYLNKTKRVDDAYVLWMPLGLFGLHHFYLGNKTIGYMYLSTFGLFGFGWIADAFFIPYYVRNINDGNYEPDDHNPIVFMSLSFCPLGLFGAHHFYLGRYRYGMMYAFTMGLCGIGYIADLIRSRLIYSRFLKEREFNMEWKYVDDAYVLWFPFGILGFHHFYLNRPGWGLLYMITFGVFGVGWLIDAYRISHLVQFHNMSNTEETMLEDNIPSVTDVLSYMRRKMCCHDR